MSFLSEIKRRKMFQVAAVYAVVAWLIVQIIVAIEAPLHLPDWVDTLVIVLMAIGFPIFLLLSWSLNLTPEGLVKEGAEGPASVSSLKIEYVLLGIIGVALIWLVYRVEFDGSEQVTVTSTDDDKFEGIAAEESPLDVLPNSIAVLPFENLSPDPDNAYFAAGIHESTLNQLSKVRDIVVISRRSVSQYEGKAALITDIAEELKVEKIMEGSVRYADGRVLISVQLIDGRNGANIWSESYERQLTDIFGVQAEVAERITDAMQIQLLPEDRARIATRQTHSSEALQYYLEALGMPSAESRPEYTDAYIGSLERAIALDPAFVEPVAELAIYYMNTGNAGEAARYAQSAIELDPQNGVGYVARGSIRKYFFDRQQEAQADLERALVLSPNNSRVLMNYCYRGADQGRDAQDYVRYCRRAVAIDPTSAMAHRRLAAVFIRTGNISEAMDHLNEAIEINPAGTHEPYVELAIAHYLAGDPDSARSSLDRAMQVMSSGATYRVDYIAYVYGLLGDIEVANDMVTSVTETAQQSQGDENIGWGLLGTRDKDRALEYWAIVVDKYINEGRPVSSGRISRFRDNWLNDPILEEPEFLQLRRRLGYEG